MGRFMLLLFFLRTIFLYTNITPIVLFGSRDFSSIRSRWKTLLVRRTEGGAFLRGRFPFVIFDTLDRIMSGEIPALLFAHNFIAARGLVALAADFLASNRFHLPVIVPMFNTGMRELAIPVALITLTYVVSIVRLVPDFIKLLMHHVFVIIQSPFVANVRVSTHLFDMSLDP
jgi:hypothetical protein